MGRLRAALALSAAALFGGALPLFAAIDPTAQTHCQSSACADGEIAGQKAKNDSDTVTYDDGTSLRTSSDKKTSWATDLDGNVTCQGPGCGAQASGGQETRSAGSAAKAPQTGSAGASQLRPSSLGPVGVASSTPEQGSTGLNSVAATRVSVSQDVVAASLKGEPANAFTAPGDAADNVAAVAGRFAEIANGRDNNLTTIHAAYAVGGAPNKRITTPATLEAAWRRNGNVFDNLEATPVVLTQEFVQEHRDRILVP